MWVGLYLKNFETYCRVLCSVISVLLNSDGVHLFVSIFKICQLHSKLLIGSLYNMKYDTTSKLVNSRTGKQEPVFFFKKKPQFKDLDKVELSRF